MKKYFFVLTILTLIFNSYCNEPAQLLEGEDIVYNEQIEVSDPGSSLPDKWWENAIFYECFVRSFKDSNNDGHGDIQGLISKLDYLKDLGITGIWLMPVTDCNDTFSGYNVKDYRSIDEAYGNMDDFKELLKEAHDRGIGVIIDMVINHSSSNHKFFQNAKKHKTGGYREWYVWKDKNPGWKLPWDPGNKLWYPSPAGYYYARFFDFLPDWNYKNPSVVAYMKDTLKFWLNMGVDGFRFDAVQSLVENGGDKMQDQPETNEVAKEFRTVMDLYENRYTVAEAPYTGDLYLGNGSDQFNSVFDFSFSGTINYGINEQDSANALPYYFTTPPAGSKFATLLSNHDPFAGKRPFSTFDGNIDKCKLASAILLTTPGIPFIYYGEEIGMATIDKSRVEFDDAVSRTPMQWTGGRGAGFSNGTPWRSINPNYRTYNVESQSSNENSLLNHYKKMISIRKSNSVLSSGSYERGAPLINEETDACATFIRVEGDQAVVVVVNATDSSQTVSLNFIGSPIIEVDYGELIPTLIADVMSGNDLYDSSISHDDITDDNYNRYPVTVPAYGFRIIPFTINPG